MAENGREFDLILWGATGFTGVLVAKYLAEAQEVRDLKWAIGGRNRQKLNALRQELGADFSKLPIVIGNSFDREGLNAIAARTRVICSTVGPYAKFGSALVAACVENGTDYCDLTGEAHWIREMVDRHHVRAQETGARIVNCCGFDSIPSDLGTWYVQQQAEREFGTPAEQVNLYVWRLRGGLSGGTLDSVATTMDEVARNDEVRRIMGDPYGINPDGERHGPDGQTQQGVRFDEKIQGWTGPFAMAAINEKLVRRSNALLDFRYGRQFRYHESSRFKKGMVGILRAGSMAAGLGVFGIGMYLKPTRRFMQRFFLPAPGEGPSEQTMEEGCFTMRLIGEGQDLSGEAFRITAEVGAERDPGYGGTSMMLGESALCLALDDADGLRGGILTPASAMGSALITRLQKAGMTFRVLENA